MMHEDGISYCDLCSPLTESCVVMTFDKKKVQEVLNYNPTLNYTWCDDGSLQVDTCIDCLFRIVGMPIEDSESEDPEDPIEYTQAEVDHYYALYYEGLAILTTYIRLLDLDRVKIDSSAKRRLKKAIALFHDALRINPESWASKWALGKIYEVLDDRRRSLKWFEEAWSLENGNVNVCREASLAAMDCSEFSKALNFADKAVALEPDDAGLHCNRALALMFLSRDAEAIEAVVSSLQLNPEDQITLAARAIVHSVAAGSRPRPKSMNDL